MALGTLLVDGLQKAPLLGNQGAGQQPILALNRIRRTLTVLQIGQLALEHSLAWKALMALNHRLLAVQQNQGRHRADLVVTDQLLIEIEPELKGQFSLNHLLLNPLTLARIDRDQHNLTSEFQLLEIDQQRLPSIAPKGHKGQQDRLSLKLAQFDGIPQSIAGA